MTTSQADGRTGGGRQAEIDDAAKKIAFASGLSGITLRRLSATVGCEPGVIAAHEPSITALVARIFEELAAEEREQTARDIAAQPTPLAAMQHVVSSLIDDSHDDFNSIWADAWSLGRRSAPLAKAARESMQAWNALVLELVAGGIASGDFNETDPDLVAMQFFALIDSTTAYSLVEYRTSEDRARLVRRTLEISLGLPEGTL
jgi:AcrR family transcriptional regulator